jgi:hypothetical protein
MLSGTLLFMRLRRLVLAEKFLGEAAETAKIVLCSNREIVTPK